MNQRSRLSGESTDSNDAAFQQYFESNKTTPRRDRKLLSFAAAFRGKKKRPLAAFPHRIAFLEKRHQSLLRVLGSEALEQTPRELFELLWQGEPFCVPHGS